ncbi:MAG: SixA phosphatase family protein [Microthrixaceae bacterium]
MTLHLVRHGSAGSRNPGDPTDTERHLDIRGLAQAEAVADRLGSSGLTRVLSSPLPRCMETIGPLADRYRLEVEPQEALREGADPGLTWALLEQLAHTEAAICSHGDVIPEMLARSEARGTRIGEPRGFSKGSIWSLSEWTGTHFDRAVWIPCRAASPTT